MKRIKIVTDSTAQLDPELVQALDITVLPMEIQLSGQRYQEGVDVTTEEFFNRVAHSASLPTTSAPTMEDFYQVYDDLGKETDKMLVLLHSGDIYRNAQDATRFFLGRYRIEVMDTQTVATGLSILVDAAEEAIEARATMDEVVWLMRSMIPHIYSIFVTDTLTYLHRDQFLNEAQALLGEMLGVKPILIMEDGEIYPVGKARSQEKAANQLVKFVAGFSQVEQIAVMRSPYNDAAFLLKELRGSFPDYDFDTMIYGPALGSEIGPLCLGLTIYEGLQ